MLRLITIGCIPFFLLFLTVDSFSAGRLFGMLAKSQDDKNFISAYKGCQEAASLNGDQCHLLGPYGPASARPQAVALQEALTSDKYSAIAVSVIKSSLVADMLRLHGKIPIITYDSPLALEDRELSQAYVGPDNHAIGMDLAKQARRLYPNGGQLFIMGDLHDPNLSLRIFGVRQGLAGNSELKLPQRPLYGEGGWHESTRSPWNAGDNIAESIIKLDVILSQIQPDVFISVGHWPIVDYNAYRQVVSQYQFNAPKKRTAIFAAIGEITPEHRQILEEKLIDGLVSIDFHTIGRHSYRIMRSIVEGAPVKRQNFIPNDLLSIKLEKR